MKWETRDVPGGSDVQVPASFFAVAAGLEPAASGKILSRTLEIIGFQGRLKSEICSRLSAWPRMEYLRSECKISSYDWAAFNSALA
jgi:hypothetical protein